MNVEPFEKDLCDGCREKVVSEYLKLPKKAFLRPKKLYKKATSWVCDKCANKIKNRLKK